MGAAISDPSDEDLHRRGTTVQPQQSASKCAMTLITSAGTAPFEAATPSAAKPRLTNSKAVGAPTPDGFAFVPHTSRVLGQHRAGVERGGEVMRDLHLASPNLPFRGVEGRPIPTEQA